MKLVLASASPRRKELLKQIGIAFEAVSADIDESPRGFTDASDYVVEMARQKALLVAKRLNTQGETQSFVLGADTTVVIDGEILGKPSDYEDAFAMIRRIQGKWHEVITGIALVDAKTLTPIVDKECTRVKIRAMTDGMLEAYLATGVSFYNAGRYGIQGYGSLLGEKLDGCYFNVMGLPIYRLSALLEKEGFTMLSWMKQEK